MKLRHTVPLVQGQTAPVSEPSLLSMIGWYSAGVLVLTGGAGILVGPAWWWELAHAAAFLLLLPWLIVFLAAGLEFLRRVGLLGEAGARVAQPAERESVRFVYMSGAPAPKVEEGELDREDLEYVIDHLASIGHAWSAWKGQRLPSGRELTEYEDFAALRAPLERIGAIVGRREGTAGKLVMAAEEIKERLRL